MGLRWLAAVACAAVSFAAVGAACSSFDEEPARADGGSEDDAATGGDGDTPDAPSGIDAGSDATKDAGADVDAAPTYVVLASGRTGLTGVAVSGSTVFFSQAQGGGIIGKVPIAGGTVEEIVTNAGSPQGIAVVDPRVYWIDTTGPSLRSALQSDGSGAASNTTQRAAGAVVATNGRLGVYLTSAQYEVVQYEATTATGANTVLSESAADLAGRGQDLVWTEPLAGKIAKVGMPSGARSELFTGQAGCASIAAEPLALYWARGNAIVQGSPGSAPRPIATGQDKAFSLAADGDGVYWLTRDGFLRATARDPGDGVPAKNVAKGLDVSTLSVRAHAIALTPTYVVWITADGKILRETR